MNVLNDRIRKIISRMLLLTICMTMLASSAYSLEVENIDNSSGEIEDTIVITDDGVSTENSLDVLEEEAVRVIMEDEVLKQKILGVDLLAIGF